MGCMNSSPKTATTEDGAVKSKLTAASRRDSIAVHKKHIKKQHTNNDPRASAPAGMTVERYD